MKIHALALGVLIGVGGLVAPVVVRAADIYVDIEPPALRHEVVPAPRRGYFWSPGYYQWRNRHHVWVGGHWVRERRGYAWVEPRWEQDGRRWHYRAGRWDRNHDGRIDRRDH